MTDPRLPPHVATMTLVAPTPFDAKGVHAVLAARAVRGVEATSVDGEQLTYARALQLPSGPGAMRLTLTPEGGDTWRISAELETSSAADEPTVRLLARRLLDLDTDPHAVDSALAADPELRPLVTATPGIRVPGAVDPHELVVRAIVGQQITVAAAGGHLARLAGSLGTAYASRFAGLTTLFPTAAQVAGLPRPPEEGPLDPDRLVRLPRRMVWTLRDAARDLADGSLVVDGDFDPEALRTTLTARRGIGPWTAAYLAMRVGGDPDAWLTGDVALVNGARRLGILSATGSAAAAHRELASRAQSWSPWRSYAAMHLWRAAV
ncbi:DNA-3-methyladenine glycosylase 2 [Actinomycetota bacterium]